MSTFKNSYFDVNVLDDPYVHPNIDLSIPLPFEDKATWVNMEGNEANGKNWAILNNFIGWVTGIDYNSIYSKNEYYYAINKHTPKFNQKLVDFMNSKLEKDDETLDQLIYDLIYKEYNLNLIKSSEMPERFKQVKEFMIKYYQQENAKNFPHFKSHNFIRLCYVTVIRLLQKMFPDGIYCNRDQFTQMYELYRKDPMSILFLPSHKSHVDYIIFHIFAVRFQMPTPTVIAGDNLNVAVFGQVMKNLGAIFIKRSFNNELYTEQNLVNLMEFLVLNNINLEVFIEGTRSRDGKLLLPKYGILKMLNQVYEKTNKNILIQPLSIAYERIYETDGYLNELVGLDKKQESGLGILTNGIKNLFSKTEETNIDKIIKRNLPYDNMDKSLNGRIFVKLGTAFTWKEYLNEPGALVNGQVNLKGLGFKVMHDVNAMNYLHEVAIVGTIIQVYLYRNPGTKAFNIAALKPIKEYILQALRYYLSDPINLQVVDHFLSLSDDDWHYSVKYQIIKFLKFIKVSGNTIEVKNPIELVYYKNLTIHLLINESLVCFILCNSKVTSMNNVTTMFDILQTFLKSEFLFEYNPNEKYKPDHLIKKLISDGRIAEDLSIIDKDYLESMSSPAIPFITSYMICIKNVVLIWEQYYKSNQIEPNLDYLINNDVNNDFPDTKKLLKLIQKNATNEEFEATNKQYLLSCLFYLNHLKLIRIFKNKSKTRAYVKIENKKDLLFALQFLQNFLSGNNGHHDEVKVEYMSDIVNNRVRRELKL